MNNVNKQWVSLLAEIYTTGEEVSPRGQDTLEILGNQTSISMNQPAITILDRKLNYKFMLGEAWWILSGSNRVKDISRFMKNIKNFSDDGITFNGAYGPKVVEQLGYVTKTLSADIDSRQALLNIWRERPGPSKDIPCTINMQFFIRGGKLHTHVYMRSSDVWLGWVYDVFNFSMISAWVGIALRATYPSLEIGELKVTAGSQHIYSRNIPQIKSILSTDHSVKLLPIFSIDEFNHPDELVEQLYNAAKGHFVSCKMLGELSCLV